MSDVHPLRKILLVVTTGGFTHAAPALEIGRALAERGHTIEFATLEGQEDWVDEYSFVSNLYTLGPGPTREQLDGHYRRMQTWDVSKGIGPVMGSKYLWDSFWPQTYHGLKGIMENAATRPAMLIADFFVTDAVNDIHVEYDLPIAIVAPNMPLFQMPCSYIPGQPGFQLPGTLTSETATMWQRIKNEILYFPDLPEILRSMKWMRKMRRDNGVFRQPHRPQKPDYLFFVNSFFGLEIPRDLPPTCWPVGPLLSPTYPPLDEQCGSFMSKHKAVLYISLGTHIILPHNDAASIIQGVIRLMDENVIDGVIWAMGKTCRADLDRSKQFSMAKATVSLGDLLDNRHPDWLFPFFAPQRAILNHDSVKVYFTHGGGSSANEALYHGKPVISMGIFSDQIANTDRLAAGGVAECLSKLGFTADELYTKAKKIIISGDDGPYQRNVLRLKRIAHVAAHRKYYAADLVEELMYDNELRFAPDENGKNLELRPMHLQTADMRMPAYKAKNWDIFLVSTLGLSAVAGSTWHAARCLWLYRGVMIGQVGVGVLRLLKSMLKL